MLSKWRRGELADVRKRHRGDSALPDEGTTRQEIRTMFAAVAPRYDFLNHFLSMGFDIAWRRATARVLSEALSGRGSRVADLCCGTGDLAFALARFSVGTVIAADFCHPMLQRAQKKARASIPQAWDSSSKRSPAPYGAGRSRTGCGRLVWFLGADALALPLRDESLDAATLAFGFRNLASYAQGLQEIRRVLKPGGLLAILEFSHLRWPILGPLFRFYLRRVLPRLGAWLSGVPGPYQYLSDSVSRFPDQESLAATLREAGFRNVRYIDFSGGVAALHLGEKGNAPDGDDV